MSAVAAVPTVDSDGYNIDDESKEEQAIRLLKKETQKWVDASAKLRKRAELYGRYLSPLDHKALEEHLQKQLDLVTAAFQKTAHDNPGFTFPSEYGE